ncbi:MAG: amidase, partial [Chitinophagaceae bacterium]
MKKLLPALLFFAFTAAAQPREDSIRQVQLSAQGLDLKFTSAEADSLLESLQEYRETYKAMHQSLPANSLPYPFAFQPAPIGTRIPADQKVVQWELPPMMLPANRNELAFYSIPQLASLIRSKKITSEELTAFFIARLKKWGDTLQSVITLLEDHALGEARAADAEIRAGKYRGPLHGIPYGLKDLFSVAGYPTTWGSTPYKNQVIDQNSYVYLQLKKAGAVLCAKLSLGALAYNNVNYPSPTSPATRR